MMDNEDQQPHQQRRQQLLGTLHRGLVRSLATLALSLLTPLVLAQTATTTTFVISPSPSAVGQATTWTATVSPSAATGIVTFKNSAGTTVGTGTLSSGVATITKTYATAGTSTQYATYGGDANYSTSTSSTITQTINKSSTTTVLTSSANPAVVNQSVTLTAQVTGSGLTGSVTFKDGSTTLGTAALSSGVATLSTSFSSAGTHSLSASWPGNANALASSSTLSQTVNAGTLTATATTLGSSVNPSVTGQTTTLTATVSPSAATGAVTFKDGTTTLGTGALSAGVATYGASFTATGNHSLTAVYAGDSSYATSSSAALNQTVNAAPTALPSPPSSPAPVVNYEYDAQGNPTKTIQAPGVSGFAFATQAAYDKLSRVTTSTNAKAGVTQFGYNGREDLTQVTDPRSLVTQYPRNGLGDATSLISPDTGTATQTYDAAGNLKTRTDSRGVLATYTYDALNRQTALIYSKSGSTSLNYTWVYDQTGTGYSNGIGRLTSTTHPWGSTQYTYDPQGRVLTDTQRLTTAGGGNGIAISRTVTYTYDAAGHVTSILYPSGRKLTVTYTAGQPSSLALAKDASTTPTALISAIQWEPFGGAKSWQWQMGASTQAYARVYDAYGRLVRYRMGNTIRDLTYDAGDRITAYTHYDATTAAATPALNQAFGYDELGRLTSVTAGSSSWSIGYDANGNRTGVTLNSTTSAYTTEATSNRLTSITNPARSFGYDSAGNTTSDSVNYTSTYSLAGRLLTLTKGGVTGTYTYDALGRRSRKFTSAGTASTVIFVYDQNNQLLGEYDRSGVAIREYVWLGSTPVAMFTPDTVATNPPLVYYFHTDHLDTPRVVTDTSNNLRWRWLAEPFGTTAPETNPASLGAFTQNLRFPGQYADQETGLSYNFFRDFDGSTGRYVQSDPIGLDGGINTYAYVENQPTKYTDPSGLSPYDDGRPSPSPGVPGPFDVLIPGTPANQRFADSAIRGLRAVVDACTPEKPCPPCKTISGRIVPLGTIAFRFDAVPPGRPHHPFPGSHYNLYKANQYPAPKCDCFWQPAGASDGANGAPPPPGAIPVEPFAK